MKIICLTTVCLSFDIKENDLVEGYFLCSTVSMNICLRKQYTISRINITYNIEALKLHKPCTFTITIFLSIKISMSLLKYSIFLLKFVKIRTIYKQSNSLIY